MKATPSIFVILAGIFAILIINQQWNKSNEKDELKLAVDEAKTIQLKQIEEFHLNLDSSMEAKLSEKLHKSGVIWNEFIEYPQLPRRMRALPFIPPRNLHVCPSSTDTTAIDLKNRNGTISCMVDLNNAFLTYWKNHSVHDFCEPSAPSKITCFDSPNKNRICQFENAMINMRKMRRRSSDSNQRLWERGFVSADCGAYGHDDIGYFSLYKPDIEGSSDAICDYVFNETVIVYSHDNIKHLGHTMNDILNVWSAIWLLGINHKEVTFLNIDGIRKGRVYDDQLHQFTRVVSVSDFELNSKICIKKLIFPPKPMLLFIGDHSRHTVIDGGATLPACDRDIEARPSPLFQRWNLHFRYIFGLLRPSLSSSVPYFQVTVLWTSGDSSLATNRSSQFMTQVIDMLGMKSIKSMNIKVTPVDMTKTSLFRQVSVVANSHLLVGLHGSGLNALSIHMPIGSTHCCGVIEIFVDGSRDKLTGYRNAAQSMGHRYEKAIIQPFPTTLPAVTTNGDVAKIVGVIDTSIATLIKEPTCISQEALLTALVD